MLSHCSSQGCKAKQQNSWATLSIQPVYCSLAEQDCKDPHSQKELCTIPSSLGHCSNTEIPGETFCKGHFFHLFIYSLKQQRKASRSKFVLLRGTLDLPVQQLSSSRHCAVLPPPLSSRVAATYLLGKSLLGRVSCGLRIGTASIWTFPCCGCPHREKLTLARALCVLAKPAGRGIPRTSGSANQSSLRPRSSVQEEGWARDTKSCAEPSLHCPHRSLSQLKVSLVPSLPYQRESSLFRTASSVPLPNCTGSQVCVIHDAGGSTHFWDLQ